MENASLREHSVYPVYPVVRISQLMLNGTADFQLNVECRLTNSDFRRETNVKCQAKPGCDVTPVTCHACHVRHVRHVRRQNHGLHRLSPDSTD